MFLRTFSTYANYIQNKFTDRCDFLFQSNCIISNSRPNANRSFMLKRETHIPVLQKKEKQLQLSVYVSGRAYSPNRANSKSFLPARRSFRQMVRSRPNTELSWGQWTPTSKRACMHISRQCRAEEKHNPVIVFDYIFFRGRGTDPV